MAELIVTDRDGAEHRVEARAGLTLMETLREFEWGTPAICGGMCSCATCHVFVHPDWVARLPAPQSDEVELLQDLIGYDPAASRLSCQVRFEESLAGLRLTIAPDE